MYLGTFAEHVEPTLIAEHSTDGRLRIISVRILLKCFALWIRAVMRCMWMSAKVHRTYSTPVAVSYAAVTLSFCILYAYFLHLLMECYRGGASWLPGLGHYSGLFFFGNFHAKMARPFLICFKPWWRKGKPLGTGFPEDCGDWVNSNRFQSCFGCLVMCCANTAEKNGRETGEKCLSKQGFVGHLTGLRIVRLFFGWGSCSALGVYL